LVHEKDPKSPETTSVAYDAMVDKWDMIEKLLGGTAALRKSGQAYLPRHEEESSSGYEERLNKATLFNMLELTLNSLVGKPFSEPLKLNEDIPEPIMNLTNDIDLQGNEISIFCRNWFKTGIAKAFAHVLIDFPTLTDEEKSTRSKADDLQENRRPYWVLVNPENVIFAYSEIENGAEVLKHIRIREIVTIKEGFAEIFVERIRVLEPGTFEIFEKRKDKKTGKIKWVSIEEGTTGLDIIPLVTFYADRQDLMFGKPPLEDLAFLNIRHWQSTSDLINILTVASFPMLAVAGATDVTGNTMAIGPRQLLGTKDPNGRFYYVEHTGRAISALREDLKDVEQMMASYGAEFLRRKPGAQTATERALDSSESMSDLKDATLRFEDVINNALAITAMWMKLESGGTVEINTDFDNSNVDEATLRSLLESRANGDLSREDFLAELQRYGILSDDFDSKTNLMRLLMEVATMGLDVKTKHSGVMISDRKKDIFLETLASTGQVQISANVAGYADTSHLQRVRRTDDKFAERWEQALEAAADILEDEAQRRAVAGVYEDIYYKGEVVGSQIKYSDQLLMFLLRGAKPGKYRESIRIDATLKGKVGVAVLPMTAINTDLWEQSAAAVHEAQKKTPPLIDLEPGQYEDVTPTEIVRK